MKQFYLFVVFLICFGGLSMSNSGHNSLPKKSVNSNEKIEFILKYIELPEQKFVMSNEQWKEYENMNKITFPDDYKMLLDLLGCGRFLRLFEKDSQKFSSAVNTMRPNCFNGARTWHESLMLDWEQDMEEEKYDPEYKMPDLFPELIGVYTWGYSIGGINFGFPYVTNENGWKIIDPNITTQFSSGWFEDTNGFIDLIYEFVKDAVSPTDGSKTTFFQFQN
jgi:hypothetical protein